MSTKTAVSKVDQYKWEDSGQTLTWFAGYEHVRDVHDGLGPGFKRIKEN